MSKTTLCRWNRTAAQVCVLLFVLLFSGTKAQAGTYLFSFTAGQLETALQGANSSLYPESAYYAIFLQSNAVSDPSQWGNADVQQAAGEKNWDGWVIDPSDPLRSPLLGGSVGPPATPASGWVGFSKDLVLGTATVISPMNLYSGFAYHDAVTTPIGWGDLNPDQAIASFMSSSDVFQFTITTPLIMSGSYTFSGHAEALLPQSYVFDGQGHPIGVSSAKTDLTQMFALTLTPQEIPEPATWYLLAGGALILLGVAHKRTAHPSRNPKQNQPVL